VNSTEEFLFPIGPVMRFSILIRRVFTLLILLSASGLIAEDLSWRVEFDDVVDSIPPARMEFVQGTDTLRLPYISNLDPNETHPEVTRVVFMVTGTLRNVDDYYQDIETGSRLSGVDDETLLFAPQFLTSADLDSFLLDESHLFWEYMGWRQGDLSDSTATHPRPWRLSSFAAADSILLRIAAGCPNLERIVIAGHSAGGQFANRMAAGSAAMDSLVGEGVAVRFVVGNPSTFLYLNEDRWVRGSAWEFAPPNAGETILCPGWNDYKYGLENPNEYMDQDAQVLLDRYESAEVVYFSGADDIQFNTTYLDKTCPAMFQGQMRLQRMQIYVRYLIHLYGLEVFQRHSVSIVQGVGHNHRQMFLSFCGLYYLFDKDGCVPLAPQMPWTELSPDIIQVSYANHGAWGDFDGDGFDDLALSGIGEENRLIHNLGGFAFEHLMEEPLGDPGAGLGCTWIDIDGDADLDLYLVNHPEANELFINEGPLGFNPAGVSPLDMDLETRDAVWLDYDSDGDLDLYMTRGASMSNLLLENNGGLFTDVTVEPLGGASDSRDASCCDVDLDGDLDIYICNFGVNRFLRNDGPAGFTEITGTPLSDAADANSASWGDFDGDGDPDLFLANNSGLDRLLRNEGDCVFIDVSDLLPYEGSSSRTAAWGDFDNDGWVDLCIGDYLYDNRLLRNTGGIGFELESFPLLDDHHPTVSVSWADCDHDGDLDLYYGKTLRLNRLLRNELDTGAHWLQVDLLSGSENSFAVGARLELYSGGRWQSRQTGSDEGYLSQNTLTAEFGLGATVLVDTLRVFWPSGTVQESLLVDVDQRINLIEPGDPVDVDSGSPRVVKLMPPHPNPFNPATEFSFVLNESGSVTLGVFDLTGRRVREFYSGVRLEVGEHHLNWDGRSDAGNLVASGVYFLRMEVDGRVRIRKMTLLK
jgi:hypothetical protein